MSLCASSRRRPVCAACFTLVGVSLVASTLALPAGAHAAVAADAAVAAVAAAEPPAKLTREQIQQLHEQCQRQIDEGRAVEAAQCLMQVYDGLVALDAYATVDLYYVLSDTVATLEAAAQADVRELCRANMLIDDYRKREPRFSAAKYAKKAAALKKKIAAAMEQARGPGGRDICAEEPPTSVEAPDPGDPGDSTPEATPTTPTEAGAEDPQAPATPQVSGSVKATRPAMKVNRMEGRRQLFQPRLPYTAMLDASFGVTLAGVVAAGIGGALYIYGIECKDDLKRCDTLAPTGVRDAGLVLMSAGAATMIIGFGLRFADHRAARKALRNMPRPAASPTAMGLTWAANF